MLPLKKRPPPGPPLAGNRVRVLRDGDETFPAMLEAIRSAERYVCLETYILRDDKVGWEFAAALTDKARHGVEVSVLFDGFGSMGLGDEFLAHLRGNGVRVSEYHPIVPWRKHWEINRRDHRKLLIADGRVGFLGGINIGDEYRSDDRRPGWRDTHIRIEGPAVRRLYRLFMLLWLRHGGPAFDHPRYRTFSPAVGDTTVRVLGKRRHQDRGAIREAYVSAFEGAEKRILITNSYFVPEPKIRRALRKAARRGVRVALLLAGNTDVRLLQLASRHYYQQLLGDRLELYEWTKSTLHAKTCVVDDNWSTVGSYNLNFRSMFHNLECNVFIDDAETAARLAQMFWTDVAQSRIIDHAFLDEQSDWERVGGQVAAAFRYWL
jgi:cardiolipin synthase